MPEQEKLNEPAPAKDMDQPAPCPVCSYPSRPQDCLLCADRLPRTGPGFPLFDIVRGFRMYWDAASRVLTDGAYLGKIVWAVALSVIFMVGLFMASWFWLWPWATSLSDWLPAWLTGPSVMLIVIVTVFFLSPVLMTVFLFPVLDPLSRLAETERLRLEPPGHPRGPIADFWHSLDTGARLLLFQIGAWIVCLPLSLLLFGLPIALAVSAFFAGFAWLDYPASRRGSPFRDKWRLARRHWALMIGYGLGFQLGLLIPFFNLAFGAPAAAVGSADLFFAMSKDGDKAHDTA